VKKGVKVKLNREDDDFNSLNKTPLPKPFMTPVTSSSKKLDFKDQKKKCVEQKYGTARNLQFFQNNPNELEVVDMDDIGNKTVGMKGIRELAEEKNHDL
jgi:hypothetical protein